MNLDVQGNYTRSEFRRESPTVLVISGAATVNYTNDGGIPHDHLRHQPEQSGEFPLAGQPTAAAVDVGRVNVPVERARDRDDRRPLRRDVGRR